MTNTEESKTRHLPPAHLSPSQPAGGAAEATGERFRDKAVLALLVAVLSFVGGAGGALLAAHFEAAKWQRETTFALRKEVLAKRMELLERTIKAVNRLQILDIYEASGSYSLIEGETLIRTGKVAAASLPTVIDSVVKAKEVQTELSVVMTLDAVYFGPKTKRAVQELQNALKSTQVWWKVDQAKTQGLLDAAAAELQFGLT